MVKKSRNPVSSNPESKVKVGLSLTPSSADRLNSIARKLGISRSELLERLAQGALNVSTDKAEVSVTWKKGEETAIDIADLQGETVAESDINEAVTAETPSEKVSAQPNPLQAGYESLQQQLTERESSIAQLQQELATAKQNLASQLAETVSKSSYESLQQQLSERESSIAQLQQQLATAKQNLENQLAETVSKSSYASLQHQLVEKSSAIASLQNQLTKLPYLENQLSQSVAKQRNYDALQQQSQEQLRTIKALREQLGQMQAVAGIGEAYLNKWRRP